MPSRPEGWAEEIGGSFIVGGILGAIVFGGWDGVLIGALTFALVAYLLTKLPTPPTGAEK